jgi:proteasome lid subunit RPN8/RPN11
MTDDRKDDQSKRPSWQLPQERQPESDAYHIWTPRPLLRSIYWKPDPPPPFETVSSTYEIFFDQRAWLTMHEHVWQTGTERTPFGYLIGDLCEDPNANRRFVTITAALPARFDFLENAAEQISREATLALQLEVERRRGVLAGWYHRHLGGEVAMSQSDVATHHQHFPEPWHCAFVFVGGGDRCAGGCFRSTPEAFAGDLLLPFYEMASNESLLARGLKRSYLDWSNYTTVDEIRSEPPPRPHIDLPAAAVESETVEPETVEPEVAGAEPPQVPEEDRLVVQPFDADPYAMAGSEAAEEPSKPTEEPSKPAEPAPPASAGDDHPPPEPPADRLEADADTDDEADEEPEEVDFEAAIDAVRPARIELDFEAEVPDREQEAARARPAEPAEAKRPAEKPVEATRPAREPPELTADAALARAGFETDGAPAKTPASRVPRKPRLEAITGTKKARVAAAVGGGVLVVAALVGGYIMFSDRDAASGDTGAGRPAEVETELPDEGGVGAEQGAAVVTPAQVDSAGRETLGVISRFYGRAVALDDGQGTCDELGQALIAVENAWLTYNADYKARFTAPLPELLAQRDERLVAGMRDVERLYDESECPRP